MIIGLTGGIAVGKSTVTKMIREVAIPVWDYDAEVHLIYRNPPEELWSLFYERAPHCLDEDRIDRAKVSEIYFRDPYLKQHIDHIFKNTLESAFTKWTAENIEKPTLVLDAPLLFDLGWDHYCDIIWVVSCRPEQQRERALARGMTEEKLDRILSYQKTTAQYIELAKKKKHYRVINTSQSIELTQYQVYNEILTIP